MNRLFLIFTLLIPLLEGAASMLQNLDDNPTGPDDETARLLRSTAAALREYLKP